MAVTLKIDAVDSSSQSTIVIYGTLVFSGSYPANGDTLNFQTSGTTQGGMGADAIKSLSLPTFATITEQPLVGTAGSGYTYLYCTAATAPTQANCGVQLFAGNTQLSAGAYPAGVTGAVVRGRFEFPAFI